MRFKTEESLTDEQVKSGLSYVIKDTRMSPKRLIEGIKNGAIMGAQIGVVAAALGIISSLIEVAGLAWKVSNAISVLSGGMLVIALAVMMVMTILVSCGAPTLIAYALVAITGAPALVRMGVDLVAAHFFVFYFAVFASVTPPVAVSAMVGSRRSAMIL